MQAKDTFGAMEGTPRTVRLNSEVLARHCAQYGGKYRLCGRFVATGGSATRCRCGIDGRVDSLNPMPANAWRSAAPSPPAKT